MSAPGYFVTGGREERLSFARAVRSFAQLHTAASPWLLGRLDYAVRLLGRRPRHLPRRINGRLRPLRRKG